MLQTGYTFIFRGIGFLNNIGVSSLKFRIYGFGSVQSMRIITDNNRKLLSKRKKFKRVFGKFYNKEKPEYNFPKAQAYVLKRIKERLIEEQKQQTKRRIIAFILLIMIVCGIVVPYLKIFQVSFNIAKL